jgi:hypothetical protein
MGITQLEKNEAVKLFIFYKSQHLSTDQNISYQETRSDSIELLSKWVKMSACVQKYGVLTVFLNVFNPVTFFLIPVDVRT